MPRTALDAERPWLKLYREEHDRRVSEAVRDFDRKILEPPVPSPYASALQVGKLERFADPTRQGCVGYVLHLLGARRVTIILPVELDDDDVFDAVSNLADAVLAKCEPPPADD